METVPDRIQKTLVEIEVSRILREMVEVLEGGKCRKQIKRVEKFLKSYCLWREELHVVDVLWLEDRDWERELALYLSCDGTCDEWAGSEACVQLNELLTWLYGVASQRVLQGCEPPLLHVYILHKDTATKTTLREVVSPP